MMKVLAALALVLTGCDLYFGGSGGGDDVCVQTGGGAKAWPEYLARNPSTGQCEAIGGGGCDGTPCGAPCPLIDIAQPDWGACSGACEGLAEQTCFATPGCHAAYLDDPAADGLQYWGCWAVAPSGPVQGSCENLDAQACSRHDDCKAVYLTQNTTKDTTFESCETEAATYCLADTDCGANAECDHTNCYPSPTCTTCPTCGACPDSNTCYGVCVPTSNPQPACGTLGTEQACIGRTDCTPVYDGSDCTCYPDGCDCKVLTYNHCETL